MILTASGNLLLELRQLTSATIPTPGLSLMVLSAMARIYKHPCYTWNASSMCAWCTVCHSASRKATSSLKVLNFLGMTFAPRETGLLNQSTSFLGLGLSPRLCMMLLSLLALSNSKANIHHFELRVTPLWALTIKHKYINPVLDIWTGA
jgi:hypothetical protein